LIKLRVASDDAALAKTRISVGGMPSMEGGAALIAGLDSSYFRPSPEIALRAKAGGVGLWGGYLASRPRVGLASPWDLASFDNIRALDGTPIAYCSGYDDPVAVSTLAKAWKVRPCLDVEGGGLRPNGDWVQGWIDAAGRDFCGLYGNPPVHPGRQAAFFVIAGYPGYDPRSSWGYVARPSGPCGWQWRGSADEYGGGTDRCWFDDWFVQGAAPIPEEEDSMLYVLQGDQTPTVWVTNLMVRMYIRNMGQLERTLKRIKKPLEKCPQYDIDRIPRSWDNPEDLTGTGLVNYDSVVFGPPALVPPPVPSPVASHRLLALPADAWGPSDQEIKELHTRLGFYPVVGADHKA